MMESRPDRTGATVADTRAGVRTEGGMTCGRCDRPTGNYTQGHYWAFCKVTKTIREFHFCCPGDCALPPAASSVDGGPE